MSIKSTR